MIFQLWVGLVEKLLDHIVVNMTQSINRSIPTPKKPYANAELAADLEQRQQEYPVLAQLIAPDLREIYKKAKSNPNAEYKLNRRGATPEEAESIRFREAYPILERIAKLLFRLLWKSNLQCGNVTVRDYVHFMEKNLCIYYLCVSEQVFPDGKRTEFPKTLPSYRIIPLSVEVGAAMYQKMLALSKEYGDLSLQLF